MKKLFISLILVLCLIGCENENTNQEKFFNPENLTSLNLANIDIFWDDNSKIDTIFSGGGGELFNQHYGFLGGINVFQAKKNVWISVFKNRDATIDAMESRIDNVASIIEEGTSDKITCTWWYSYDGWNSAIFVNKWNTIIEVLYSEANNEVIENMLIDTANELAKRVDNLSE